MPEELTPKEELIKKAAIRLMQEIWTFTDRPDYERPEAVRDAFAVLEEIWNIRWGTMHPSDTSMYPPEEEPTG